jgi:hypothetical protein
LDWLKFRNENMVVKSSGYPEGVNAGANLHQFAGAIVQRFG